jgi:hypothetical protein
MRWLLPIGPLAIAVLRLILPYDTTDDAATAVQKVAAEPNTQSLVVWLGVVAMLTLVPAVTWIAAAIRDRAPKTTTAAVILLVPAYLTLGLLAAQDAAMINGDTITHPALDAATAIFVAGHVIGTVLLGAAMWQAGLPRWAAVATIVSQPLHFVAAVVLASHELDFVAWGLNAAGFAAVALSVVKTPDRASGLSRSG